MTTTDRATLLDLARAYDAAQGPQKYNAVVERGALLRAASMHPFVLPSGEAAFLSPSGEAHPWESAVRLWVHAARRAALTSRARGQPAKPEESKRGAEGRRTSDAWTAEEWKTVAELTPDERRRRILTPPS